MSFRRHFFADRRGSISVAFALSIAVFITGIGVALDYARISSSQTSLQSALDSAILSAGKGALATGDAVDKARMIAEIKANLPEHLKPMADSIQITQTADKLTVQVTGSLNNPFGSFHGNPRSSITAAASVELGASATRLEIALVLDTTGSMELSNKMVELKKAANQLIDSLVTNRQTGQDISIGVVPFATQVRVDTSNATQSWITLRPSNGQQPLRGRTPHPDELLEATHISTWDGCIMDRDSPLNRSRALPSASRDKEKYPAQNCRTPMLQPILPLTTDLGQVRRRIDALTPSGDTNTVIGMIWGLNILNPSGPLGQGAASASLKPIRAMVFLTDGENTRDRFTGRGDEETESRPRIDADMRELCRDAKTADVRIFTVRVIQGNDALLRDCATDPVDFYPISNASELTPAFRAIGGKIKQLRLAS